MCMYISICAYIHLHTHVCILQRERKCSLRVLDILVVSSYCFHSRFMGNLSFFRLASLILLFFVCVFYPLRALTNYILKCKTERKKKMPKFFKAVKKAEDSLDVVLTSKDYGALKSINGVETSKILALVNDVNEADLLQTFNNDLPKLLKRANGEETETFEFVFDSTVSSKETIVLEYPTNLLNSIKQNFAGIIAVGKAANLEIEDIRDIFLCSLSQFRQMNEMEVTGKLPPGMQHLMDHIGHQHGNFPGTYSDERAPEDEAQCAVQ